MRTIRASEIGTYQFCQRAWWYGNQGEQPDNIAQMEAGSEIHYRHSHSVIKGGCLRTIAYGLMLLALALLIAHISIQFM
jgi:hypothetical protein